tara:strand:- start:528 stop:902 length:375 start_codon:yes stop_codon:yes gene_type:complete
MFAFITIGTNNLKKSSQFYDELLKTLGIIRVIQDERYVGYSKEDNLEIIEFYIMCPFDKKEATIGNGTMISFDGKTPEKVNEFHQKALKIGATNEGFPGPRHGEDYYAYIRDLDGNKICVFAAT